MAVFAEDDFDRSNRSLSGDTASDGGTWGSFGGGIGTSMSITSNYAHSNDSGPNHLIHSGTPGANDYTITASVALRAENGRVGLLARCDGSGSGYRFQYDNATNRWQLQRFDSGSLTTIDNNAPVTMGVYAASDLVLDVSGSSISGSYDGTERASTTDATYSTGQVGIMGYGGSGATSGQYEGEIHTFSANDTTSGGTTYTYTPSGGITLAGAATKSRVKAYSPSGGVALSGSAGKSRTKAFSPSGGITFAGAATTTQGGANTYTYTPAGGYTFSGTAIKALTKAARVSGGITFSGAATTLLEGASSNTYTYSPSGGVVLNGSAPVAVVKVVTPAGGITFSGAASASKSGWTQVSEASTTWTEVTNASTTWAEV